MPILFILIFITDSFSQSTMYIDWVPCKLEPSGHHFPADNGNTETVCQGETLEIVFRQAAFEGSISCYDGAALFLTNTTHDFNPQTGIGECVEVTEVDVDFEYAGGSIVSDEITYDLSIQPSQQNCPFAETLTLQIVPIESDTLKVSWQAIKVVNFGGDIQTVYYDYVGEIIINVIPIPTPVLSTNTYMVQPNDNIELLVDNCEEGVRAYFYEECEGFDESNPMQQPVNCNGTNTIVSHINAPDYTTELTYMAIFERYDGCDYEFTYSNPIVIQVKDTIINESCESPYISVIDAILSDLVDTTNWSYHLYTVFDTVCATQDTICNLGLVWSHMKSDIRYQVPSETGLLSDEDLSSTGSRYKYFEGIDPEPQEIQVDNCKKINIETNLLRSMIKPLILVSNIFSFNQIEICGKGFNSTHDPIIMAIDEENYCITNYTLPGHVLFPGKVTRCLTESCEGVYIKTVGEGFHFCGSTFEGLGFSSLNKYIGPRLFKKVDKKLKGEY